MSRFASTGMDGAAAKGGRTGSFGRLLVGQDVKVRRNLKDTGFIALAGGMVLLVAVAALGYLWARLDSVRLGYEISKLNEAKGEEAEKNKRLRIEINRLKSPERIERIASTEIGLSYPSGKEIVHISAR